NLKTKKPLHPIVSMSSRNKKEENPTNGDTVAGVAYHRFDTLVILSTYHRKAFSVICANYPKA
ncbi:MAG: hypothetical protein Q7U74_04635, partial [Saprospiraceae bacterium]|nr:hypothetical protein [Saprospiraceae bacterium]